MAPKPSHRGVGAALRLACVGLGAAPSMAFAQPRLLTGQLAGPPYSTAIAAPPGNRARLFVGEKGAISSPFPARIRIVDLLTNTMMPTPFLTITGVYALGEQGLLGLAFDPAYATSGHFYVHYTSRQPLGSRVVRYTVSADPNVADPLSQQEVLFVPQIPDGIHQGGWLEFGLDGYLYTSLGDAGVGANAQNLTNLYGKILRLDVSTLPYSIPPTNPFFGSPPARPEIWAYGLRNPWRCSFDQGTGDLWIGDVGEALYEEVNYQPAPGAPPLEAVNYGWPGGKGPNQTEGTPPIYSLPRPPGFGYIVGGYVYRGEAIPWLRGAYIFKTDRAWSLRYDGSQVYDLIDWSGQIEMGDWSFGTDGRGEIYGVGTLPLRKMLPRCRVNCDGSVSPILDLRDFVCFQKLFALGDLYADCNRDSVLNLADFGCFQTRFALGCP